MYRKRFGLTGHPLGKDAQGKTFFEQVPGYSRLTRAFDRLAADPGLGVLTGEAGVGKTAAIRNLCAGLPRPDYVVTYLCDTAVSPLDLYRTLANELGVKPSHRRAQLWVDIKKALIHMRDERQTAVVLIIDEAQHLSDPFLVDLAGFLNFGFDSREVLTLWLVGTHPIKRHLEMQQHAPLAMRVATSVQLEPIADRKVFVELLSHGLAAVGGSHKIVAEPAIELLFRASRGLPRMTSKILRNALHIAHERDQDFLDEHVLEAAVDETILPVRP
ncbi:MAG: ATP-binding protein [bacterium]|nr:ATP-binding protein [bacterium]